MPVSDICSDAAPFFGFMGVATALMFSNIGAAYGTAKSGVGLYAMGVMKPGLVIRNIIPVIMAGILGIYGLILGALLNQKVKAPDNTQKRYTMYEGYAHMASGLCCGLGSLGTGIAVGIVGDAGVRAVGQEEKLFVGMILILIFAEALGLYAFIVSLLLSQHSAPSTLCK